MEAGELLNAAVRRSKWTPRIEYVPIKVKEEDRQPEINFLKARIVDLELQVVTLNGQLGKSMVETVLAKAREIPLPAAPPSFFCVIRAIKKMICNSYGVTEQELVGGQRRKEYIKPRHLAIYLCTKHTPYSLPRIGKLFRRDHTSILHARNSITALRAADEDLNAKIIAFETEIKNDRSLPTYSPICERPVLQRTQGPCPHDRL